MNLKKEPIKKIVDNPNYHVIIVEMNMNTPFAENARPKTVYVQLTRNTNGTYTVEQARVLEKTNQYSRSIRRVNKRAVTSELKSAAQNGELYVA